MSVVDPGGVEPVVVPGQTELLHHPALQLPGRLRPAERQQLALPAGRGDGWLGSPQQDHGGPRQAAARRAPAEHPQCGTACSGPEQCGAALWSQ